MVGRWVSSPLLGICVVCLSYAAYLYVSLLGDEQHGRYFQSIANLFRTETRLTFQPKRNAKLEEALGQLIEEAKVAALERRIFTETEAREKRQGRQQARSTWLKSPESSYWSHVMEASRYRDVAGEDPKPILCRTDSDCGRDDFTHGVCRSNRCLCVKGFSGTRCTRSVHVIRKAMAPFPLGFDGNLFRNQTGFEVFDQCYVFIGSLHYSNLESPRSGVFSLGGNNDDEHVPLFCLWENKGCQHVLPLYSQDRTTSVFTDEFLAHVSNHNATRYSKYMMNLSAVLLSLNMCTDVTPRFKEQSMPCASSDLLCQLITDYY